MRLAAAAILAFLTAGSGLALAQATSTPPAAAPGTRAPAATASTPATGTGAASAGAAASSQTTASHARAGTAATALPANAMADEAAAKQKCGADPVVWVNTSSKAFHTADSRYFGKTRHGAYMCQKDAQAGGYHPAKSATAGKKKPGSAS